MSLDSVVATLISPRIVVLYVFLASAAYVHFRGRERHGFLRQLTDHSTLMAPYNVFVYLFSAVPNRPIQEVDDFPELGLLKENWEVIRDEAARLYDAGHIKRSEKYDDLAFNSFFKSGWKRFYLKWYGEYLASARELCPRTVELLEGIPTINAAMFTALAPNSHLVRHRDPFAGSLRYHLGLITPNSDDCRILIDGTPYSWRDGGDIVFDETYMHRAENRTDRLRVILFCDVERPLRGRIPRAVNRLVECTLVRAAATANVEGERIGALNKAFSFVYRLRLVGKRLKSWNRTVYYALKLALLAGLLYLLFLA